MCSAFGLMAMTNELFHVKLLTHLKYYMVTGLKYAYKLCVIHFLVLMLVF